MSNLPVAYRSVKVGEYGGELGGAQPIPRYVALPTNLPPERLQMAIRAAQWVDETMLRWLTGLPVYAETFLVVLSGAHVIHLQGAPFACGTLANDGDGEMLPLREATATYFDEHMQRKQPTPCRICFATGLLVGREA